MNRTPILNMWTSVLGNAIGNPRMVDRGNFSTFARTLAILWIFLWFIIRNAYQGALYTSLQDSRFSSPYNTFKKNYKLNCKILTPPPDSFIIKDMFNKDRYEFKMVTNLKTNYLFKNKIHNISISFILGGHDVISNFPRLYQKNIKGVAFANDLTQKAFNMRNFPHKRLEFTKDRLFMYSPVFLFRKKSMLTDAFDKQIKTLQQSGLIDFWIKNYTFERGQKIKNGNHLNFEWKIL